MSNPKELWENTQLTQKSYPIQIFVNTLFGSNAGDCIIYLHWHAHMELMIVRSGKITFYVDSHIVNAEAGDVVLVPGGSLHVGYLAEDGDGRVDCIVFNPSLFQEWSGEAAHLELISPFFAGKINFPFAISKTEIWNDKLRNEINSIADEMTAKDIGYQLIVKASLYAWFIQMARYMRKNQPSLAPSEAYFTNRDLFKQLIEWIKGHYAENLTVKQAAHMVGLDPYYFCKQFKKLTGRTFIDYVNVCRVNEAERRLTSTQESISEIARIIGCENANYFTKLYKKYKGKTPSDERRS